MQKARPLNSRIFATIFEAMHANLCESMRIFATLCETVRSCTNLYEAVPKCAAQFRKDSHSFAQFRAVVCKDSPGFALRCIALWCIWFHYGVLWSMVHLVAPRCNALRCICLHYGASHYGAFGCTTGKLCPFSVCGCRCNQYQLLSCTFGSKFGLHRDDGTGTTGT
jgi:hypothetical protein